MKKIVYTVLVFTVLFVGSAQAMQNLTFIKESLIRYHDSGKYYYQIDKVTQQAQAYLAQRIAENKQAKAKRKLAIVFDIDETALSNYPAMLELDFGYIPRLSDELMNKANDLAIPGALKLYRYAIAHKVAVFFITGRKEQYRKITTENLKAVGYKKWSGLYFEPESYDKKSVIGFKSATRRAIEQRGYDIVFSMGDQYSDLAGGYADRTFKIPDPFYYLP